MFLLSSAATGWVASINKQSQYNPNADDLSAVEAFLSDFIGNIIFYPIIAAAIALVLRSLGGNANTLEVLRIAGAAAVWTILGAIFGIAGYPLLAGILALVGFIAYIIGLSAMSGKSGLVVFIAVIIGAILAFILLFILMIFIISMIAILIAIIF